MVEVRLNAVRVDLASNTPVVLLQETGGSRTLPIFIGTPEATAIAYALDRVEIKRPLTHDLMKDLLEALGAKVTGVVITELQDSTYYADLHLQLGDRQIEVSARPSDAIALAVRAEVPIFVEDELMSTAGVILETDDSGGEIENSEEIVGEFREFLSNIRPEDFAP